MQDNESKNFRIIRFAVPVLAALVVGGCTQTPSKTVAAPKPSNADYVSMYSAKKDGNVTVPAVDVSKVDRKYRKHPA